MHTPPLSVLFKNNEGGKGRRKKIYGGGGGGLYHATATSILVALNKVCTKSVPLPVTLQSHL